MTLPRFYPILDTGLCAARGISPGEFAAAVLAAGARVLQFRHKGHFSRLIFDAAASIRHACQAAQAAFVLNDRVDIALLLEADAVHLGQDDLAVADVRRIAGQRLRVGLSTHNEDQLLAARTVSLDYLAIGPVFLTRTKDHPDPETGLAGVVRARQMARVPLVAIGGITRGNAGAVLASGADAVAVIGDLFPQECSSQAVRARAEEWRKAVGD